MYKRQLLNINGTDITAAKKNNVDPKTLKKLQEESAAYQKLQEAGLTDEEKIQKALKDAADAKAEYAKKSNQMCIRDRDYDTPVDAPQNLFDEE